MKWLLLIALPYAVQCFKGKPVCRDMVKNRTNLPCREYQVTTEDGFELNVVHVTSVNGTGSPVVILQHGLLGSAAAWFDQDSNESLGYLLPQLGYDVIAPNSRGNWYSLVNDKLNVSQREFWELVDFDFMAKYDLPRVVEFATNLTGAKKVFYIGHSQGTTQCFASLSKNYNNIADKIELFIAMAPVTQTKHCKSKTMVDLATNRYDQLVRLFGWASFPPVNLSAIKVLEKLGVHCDSPDESLCENIIYDMEGATDKSVNASAMTGDLGFDPAGTSIRNMQHWCQQIRKDGFHMFNYGFVGNFEHYGTANPPEYVLGDIKSKVAIFYGSKDELATPTDALWTISQLVNSDLVFVKEIEGFAHNDFIWSMNATRDLFPEIKTLLKQYVTDDVRSTNSSVYHSVN